jgi:hypothetical protein
MWHQHHKSRSVLILSDLNRCIAIYAELLVNPEKSIFLKVYGVTIHLYGFYA